MIKTVFVTFLLGLIVAATAVTKPDTECYIPCEKQFHECRKTNSYKEACCIDFKSCFKNACSFETFFCPPTADDASEGDDVWGMEGAFNRKGSQ